MLITSQRCALPAILGAALLAALAPASTAQDTAANQMASEGSSNPTLSYSLVEGGIPPGATDAGNNGSESPLFDADLNLEPGSPAIDAGDGSALPLDLWDLDGDGITTSRIPIDLAGNRRVFDGGSGVAVVDIGAFESDAPVVRVGLESDPIGIPDHGITLSTYPNPFSQRATIELHTSRAGPVTAELYDVLGRRIRTLFEANLPANGRQTLALSGDDLQSGMYVVRVTGDGFATIHHIAVAH